MGSPNVSFAKISANPTEKAWSQSHNAGSLFLVISLLAEDNEKEEELPTLGKQLISDLQAEFFTLENKTLATIEEATITATKNIPPEIPLSLALVFIKDTILYVFVRDGGKVLLKREAKLGTLLQTEGEELVSASGYLQTGDILMLQTKQFATSVPEKTLKEALDYTLPSDIAETLSPHIHGGEEAAASAVIVAFQGVPQEDEEEEEAEQKEEILPPQTESPPSAPKARFPETQERESDQPEEHEEPEQSQASSSPTSLSSKVASLFSSLPLPRFNLSRRHKLILSVAIIILGLLLVSIYFTKNSQETKESQALFEEAFSSAKKDYEEGLSLLSLNKALAREDFQRAKDTIVKAKGELADDSTEEQQLVELETKIDERLSETQNAREVKVQEVDGEKAPLLALFKDKKALAVTEDEESRYYLTKDAIYSVNKSTDKEEKLITNEDNWSNTKSLAVFTRNLYVLDKDKGLIKFVPTSDGYTATSYFKTDAPTLSEAVSMAIDASVWILFSDGRIEKYTRGEKDSFTLSGITNGIKSPVSLLTSPEIERLYVLDRETSSILKISKDGALEEGYQTEILKDADAFTLSADEKNAYILANDKFYELAF